jgi:uncharacterized protein (TIGR00251 family)
LVELIRDLHECHPRLVARLIRVSVHVHPGSKVASVGGTHGSSLVVRVKSRAVDGAATSEVLKATAAAFGVSASAVSLLRGTRSREKLLMVDGPDETLALRLEELLGRT